MNIDELLDLERRGWQALCDSTGAEFYGEIMTDDALMVLANGQVMDRDAVVSALSQAPAWDSYDIDDARIIPIADAAAALVYRGTGRRGAADEPFVGAMSSTYVRVDDEWKLALYQQTAIT